MLVRLIAGVAAVVACGPALADWEYVRQEDPMTGKFASYAVMQSSDSLMLGFPYRGENPGKITVRQHPKYGLDVIFSITKGQMVCDGYDDCSVSVRFDEGKVQRFATTKPADGSSDTFFIDAASRFIGSARKAKRILIQATYYQNGSQILTFETTTPLVWPRK